MGLFPFWNCECVPYPLFPLFPLPFSLSKQFVQLFLFPSSPRFFVLLLCGKSQNMMEERGGGDPRLLLAYGPGQNVNFPKDCTYLSTFFIECDIVFCQLIRQFFRCFQVRRIPFWQTISHTEKEEEELGAAAAAEIEKEEGEELKDVLLLPPSSPAKKVAFAVKMERQKQRILYFFYSRSLFLFLSLSFPPLGLIVLGWCHRQIY